MSELGKCPTCGSQVSTNAARCPQCNESEFSRIIYKGDGSWKKVDLRTGKDIPFENSETRRSIEVSNKKEERRQLINSVLFLLVLVAVPILVITGLILVVLAGAR